MSGALVPRNAPVALGSLKARLASDGFAVIGDRLKKEERQELLNAVELLTPLQKEPLEPVYLALKGIPGVANDCEYLLRAAGLPARLQHAWLLNKKPHEPPRPWHFDWQWWQLDVAFDEAPGRLGCLIYPHDTETWNGCLRVIPGSHRRYVPGVHEMTEPYARHPDEVDVPVKGGHIVVFDARLLHATHSNDTTLDRPCVTIWFDCLNWPKEPTDCDAAAAFRRRGLGPPALCTCEAGSCHGK